MTPNPANAPPSAPATTPEATQNVQTITIQASEETWGGWFRAHFTVFVLLFMCVFMFFYILHLSHHGQDAHMMQFAEGHSQTFVGALVGALTAGGAKFMSGGGK